MKHLLALSALIAFSTANAVPVLPDYIVIGIEFSKELEGSPEPEHLIGCTAEIIGRVELDLPINQVDCDDAVDFYYDSLRYSTDRDSVRSGIDLGIRLWNWRRRARNL